VRDYLEKIGIDSGRLVFTVGVSDLVLPSLCTARVFDTALIDGSHGFPYPAVDWHYVTRALKIGGQLICDDIHIPAVAYVFRYMQSDPNWQRDAVVDERAAIFTLISEPPPGGDWTRQPFNDRYYYGFAPLPRRARLMLRSEIWRMRRQLGLRYPGLRRVWKSISLPQ
jgi:hypothetical protein